MRTIGAFEAKNRLSELLAAVENGDVVTITKHGRAVAQLIPISQQAEARQREAIEWLKRTRKNRRLDGLSIRDLINEGRRF